MLASVLFCLLASAKLALCAWPYGSTFAYWLWQSAVVANQWLYIDGGEYYLLEGGSPNVYPNSETLAVDLSQSWTTTNMNFNSISRPAAMTTARRPPLWYDPQSNLVMERGGWAYVADASYLLWSFTPDGNGGANWALDQSSTAAEQVSPTFGSAFTATASNFYSLGGAIPGGLNTSADPLNQYGLEAQKGFVTYNFASGGWKNTSSLSSSPSGYSVQSQVVSLPDFGKAGLLAVLGGESPPNSSYQYEQGNDLVDMSNITIYDIQSDTWHYQTATGSVPPPRSEFCAVGSAPTDNSTYEIYVFGGSTNATVDYANPNDADYLDVFILSMPSFVWFKAGALAVSRRANHFCHVIGQGQMLVIGGRDPSHNSSDGAFWPDNADPWTHGLGIFDMPTLHWSNAYNASATNYEQPAMVKQYYANHANATTWNDPALAALFTPRSYPSTTTSTTTSTIPVPTPSPSSTPTKTGAIVGGVVGGLGGLALIAAVSFVLLRRRRRNTRPAKPAQEMPSEQPSEMESHAVEMPAGHDAPLNPKLAPSYAVELDVPNDTKDQNFKDKPVSYA